MRGRVRADLLVERAQRAEVRAHAYVRVRTARVGARRERRLIGGNQLAQAAVRDVVREDERLQRVRARAWARVRVRVGIWGWG